ncbi:MAG: hypothetical protein PHT33_13220, partial [bacterium]|nr:hypothetical protein [bacterium]
MTELLSNDDKTIALMAAKLLAYNKVKNAFPVLIEFIKTGNEVKYKRDAAVLLEEITGLRYGFDYERWYNWWL